MEIIKSAKSLHWTIHSQAKMRHYGLSEARVRRILHTPSRIEEGVAPKTVAVMQRAGNVKHPYELWVMVQDKKSVRHIISAWRYPGVTKPRSGTAFTLMRAAYEEYLNKADAEMAAAEDKKNEFRERFSRSKWFKGTKPSSPKRVA